MIFTRKILIAYANGVAVLALTSSLVLAWGFIVLKFMEMIFGSIYYCGYLVTLGMTSIIAGLIAGMVIAAHSFDNS